MAAPGAGQTFLGLWGDRGWPAARLRRKGLAALAWRPTSRAHDGRGELKWGVIAHPVRELRAVPRRDEKQLA